MSRIDEIIDKELKIFDRGIVATPKDRAFLDSFAQANNGSMDVVLTQMAVQLGYITALKFIKQESLASLLYNCLASFSPLYFALIC